MTIAHDKIPARIEFLREVAEALLQDGVLPERDVVLRAGRIPLLARGYFILNEAYKGWRIESDHNTELPKVAALQTMAIMAFQPFRPVDPSNVTSVAQARCNEIYALAAAEAAMGTVKNISKKDFVLRTLDTISSAGADTLEPYIVDINYSVDRPLEHYVRDLVEKDKRTTNYLISLYELLSDAV